MKRDNLNKESVILKPEEINAYMESILLNEPDHAYITLFGLAALSGLKKDECCGLKWGNINWKKKTISVTHKRETLEDINVPLKNPRTAALPDPLADILRLARSQQEYYYERRVNEEEYVLMTDNNLEKGTLPNPAFVSKLLKFSTERVNRTRVALGKEALPKVLLWDLRATFITLCKDNVDYKELIYSTGHGFSNLDIEDLSCIFQFDTENRKSINDYIKSIITIEIK